MFLYLYMFEYESMFVPFIHVVCPLSENAPKYDFTSPVSIIIAQARTVSEQSSGILNFIV